MQIRQESANESDQEFADFYLATERSLRAYARRCVAGSGMADDLVQEAYVRLLTSSKANLPPAERKLYLFRIATNLIRNHWSRGARWEHLEEAIEGEYGPRTSHDPNSLDVRRALHQMPPKYRSLLWLAYVEEYDHREIADILGLSRLSIKVLLSRARKKMATFWRANK